MSKNIIIFDIVNDFKLRISKKYRGENGDKFIDELIRRGKFNMENIEDDIEKYLREELDVKLSKSLLFVGIAFGLLVLSIFVPIIAINILSVTSFIVSLYFFLKYRTFLKEFNFNKSMFMSLTGLLTTEK